MSIVDLLNHIGVENVQVQPLIDAMKDAQMNKRGETEITFYTRAITVTEILLDDPKMVGMILWLPKAKLPKP